MKASAGDPITLPMIECFWTLMAQLSISRWIDRVPSKANPADAPSRREDSILDPQVRGELAPLQQLIQLGQVLEGLGMSVDGAPIK